MRTLKLDGIIVFKKDFGEQDRIFHILTESDGKIEVVAKNVRNGSSKRAGHMELFNYGTFFLYKSPNHYYLNQCETINEFPKIKNSLEAINTTYFATEILDKLTETNSPHEELFHLMKDFLKLLSDNPFKSKILLMTFKIQLLKELGLLPDLIVCEKCGEKLAPEMKFIPEEHHFYCSHCIARNGITLSPNAIKLFYFLSRNHIGESTRIKQDKNLDESMAQLITLIDFYLENNITY